MANFPYRSKLEFKDISEETSRTYIFGEVLGKHSEIYGPLTSDDLEVESEDQEFIAKLVKVMRSENICGYNPLDYISEDEEEDEDEV